jgi:SAM-dependent methyltransferase
VDIGCSTGLSTLKLHASFPEASIVGLDLSPYMLAVASHNLKHRPEQRQVGIVRAVHSKASASTFPPRHTPHVSVLFQAKVYDPRPVVPVPRPAQASERIEYLHAAGEATGLPDSSVDMVSICLVNHELPTSGDPLTD